MSNNDGAVIALQAQLDAVADAIGRERMRAADGYHGTAALKVMRELNATRQECVGAQRAAAEMREQVLNARAAAQVYVERVDALGLAADDNDPLVMVTTEPIGAAQADLFAALGLLVRDESGKVSVVKPTETVEQLRAERDTARALAVLARLAESDRRRW